MRFWPTVELSQNLCKFSGLSFCVAILPLVSDLHGLCPEPDSNDSLAPQQATPNFVLKVIQESFALQVRRSFGNQQFASESGFLRFSPVGKIEQHRIQFFRINPDAAPACVEIIRFSLARHKTAVNINRPTSRNSQAVNRFLHFFKCKTIVRM